MDFKSLVFYFLSVTLLFSALRVITARNPVHSALFLVLSFFTGAGLWLLLQAEFLAIALVLVYVGAVMVLFLFVVMMLDINFDKLREGFWRHLPLAAFAALLMVLELGLVLISSEAKLTSLNMLPTANGYGNTKEIGKLLYTHYVFPFELAAVVLLVAIIAAIALTLRRRKQSKYQNPSMQVKVRRQDRVRLVSMPAEKE